MGPMSPASPASPAKRHGRNISNRALPRRSTKGPLEPYDPLAPQTVPQKPEDIHHEQPPAPSPPPPQLKDLSFLLHPSIYHTLPPPLFPPSSPPSLTSPSDLLKSCHYHAAATQSAQRLTQPPPPTQSELFSLIYIRFAALINLNHISLAITEAKALEEVNSPFYRHENDGSSILPWQLRVLVVRLQTLDHDARRGGVGGFYELARDARAQYARCKNGKEREVWGRRIRAVGCMTVDAMVEMADLRGAIAQMKGLKVFMGDRVWGERMALIYMKVGDANGAKRVVDGMQDGDGGRKKLFEALLKVCEGDYFGALIILQGIDNDGCKTGNDLALTQFYTGNVSKSVDLLEQIVGEGDPSKEVVFNLATCFELMAERGVRQRKETLLTKVREGMSGTEGMLGPEDFKLA